MQRDLQRPIWMYIKAALLLAIGFVASAILLIEHSDLRTAALLAVAIWGFCRAYYFAFYVIEHYVDSTYRFAGLIDFARYALNARRAHVNDDANPSADHDSQRRPPG